MLGTDPKRLCVWYAAFSRICIGHFRPCPVWFGAGDSPGFSVIGGIVLIFCQTHFGPNSLSIGSDGSALAILVRTSVDSVVLDLPRAKTTGSKTSPRLQRWGRFWPTRRRSNKRSQPPPPPWTITHERQPNAPTQRHNNNSTTTGTHVFQKSFGALD
jgi:hypothetical protein